MAEDLFGCDANVIIGLPNQAGFLCQEHDATGGYDIQVPHGRLLYVPRFFNKKVSDRALDYLLSIKHSSWRDINWSKIQGDDVESIEFTNIEWQHEAMSMYGRQTLLPRLSAWYGDDDCDYTFSGISLSPKGWNPCLSYIRDRIEIVAAAKFNSVLLNWYRDGNDHIGWHTDNEKELGHAPTIASVNFGESRDFFIRSNCKTHKIKIPLHHGSLLVMMGDLQDNWQHSVPKRAKVSGARVNLTFRTIY